MKHSLAFACLAAASAVAAKGTEEIERQIADSDRAIIQAQARLADRCRLTDYASLVRKVGGTNVWTAALQRAVDQHEIVEIPAANEKYYVDSPVTIPSNRRIEAKGATIALLHGTRTLMLRNRNAVDGTLKPISATNRDSNIAIDGGRWEDWMNGRAGYGKTGRMIDGDAELAVGNFRGVSTLFYFGNCDRVSIRNTTFARASGFAVQSGDGDGRLFENIVFDDCYADGLHLNGGLTRVHAKNIRGKVGDDLVALNAYDWLNSSVNFGPQHHILCEDLELILKDGKGYPAIRILPAKFKYADGRIVDCSISDVVFRRVKGITTFKMYLQTPRYQIGGKKEWSEVGSGGNICFEDIEIDLDAPIDRFSQYMNGDPVCGHFGAFEFGANLTSVTLRNIDITFHSDKFPLSHLATVGPKSIRDGEYEIFDPNVSCTVGQITLENIRCFGVKPAELIHATSFAHGGNGKIGEIRRLTGWKAFPIYGGGYVQNVIFTRNPNVAYMTIDVGGPYRSDDGCRSWQPLHGYMSYEMKLKQLDHARSLSVDPRDENNIICASGNSAENMGGIVVSRDGGRTWKQTASGNYLSNGRRRWMGQLLSRNPWNPDELVTGGDCTGLMKSEDNGETWRPLGLDDHWFSHIHYDLAVKGRVWACAPGYEDVPEEAMMVASGREPNPKPRYGRLRGLYRSDDNGEHWVKVEMERVPEELCQIVGDERILGILDEQFVTATTDGGKTWTDFSQGLERLGKGKKIGDDYGCQRGRYKGIGAGKDFYVIADTRGNVQRRGIHDDRWAAVKANPIVYSEPEKEMRNYDSMPSACTIVVNPHDNRKWYITDWYSVWETEDSGLNWHSRIHGAQQLVPFTIAASPFDEQTVFYATADSRMYVSHDGTRTFTKMTDGVDLGESVNSVAFSQVTPGLALVTGGKFKPSVRITKDDGRTWNVCSTNGLLVIRPDNGWTKKRGFYAPFTIVADPKRDVFYIAMGGIVGKGEGGVYVTHDLGEHWQWFGEGLPVGEHMFKFCEWGNGEAMAISESGDLMCWDQGGQKVFRRGPKDNEWQRVDFSMLVIDPVSNCGVQASVRAVPGKNGWFFASCGNGRGSLFRSTDGGRSFRKVSGISGMFSPIAFDRHTPGLMLVAGSGSVFVSRDYGAHFSTLPGGFDFPSGYEPHFFVDRGRIWAIGSGNGAWEYLR